MLPMTPARRLRWTALLFLIALIFLAIASLTHDVWPLFVGWIPLLAVPWILTRAEAIPEDAGPDAAPARSGGAALDAKLATAPGEAEPQPTDRPSRDRPA
jgi:hypothetical protein